MSKDEGTSIVSIEQAEHPPPHHRSRLNVPRTLAAATEEGSRLYAEWRAGRLSEGEMTKGIYCLDRLTAMMEKRDRLDQLAEVVERLEALEQNPNVLRVLRAGRY